MTLQLPIFITVRMLTDREYCYNVRDKKLITWKPTFVVDFSVIMTFSMHGEDFAFSDISIKQRRKIFYKLTGET